MPALEHLALEDAVRATVSRHEMLASGGPVVAMVSGGGDSTALARLLAGGVAGKLYVSLLHINHQLRDADSDADEAFVAALADELGVDARTVRFDVGAFAAEEGLNVEDAGRRVRYRFAEEELDARCDAAGVARSHGRIATAHTRDDRVETFLMRMLTGAGAGGLSSIPYVRHRIVRPLLDVPRVDVRSWLEERGHGWCEDASNLDVSRLRVLVRERMLPVAREANPRFDETVARTLDLLGDEDGLLSEMAEAFAAQFARVEPGKSVAFERELMSTLSRPMARRTVREALLGAFPVLSRLEMAHVDSLVDGLAQDGFSHDLPEGLEARTEYEALVVRRAADVPVRVAPTLLAVPGATELVGAGVIRVERASSGDEAGTPDSIVIDASTVGELVADPVRAGDRMRPLGMSGTKKLSDLLVDAKVPRRLRSAVPVVRDGDRIVWLAGVRMGDDFRVRSRTRDTLRMTWQRSEEHGSWA